MSKFHSKRNYETGNTKCPKNTHFILFWFILIDRFPKAYHIFSMGLMPRLWADQFKMSIPSSWRKGFIDFMNSYDMYLQLFLIHSSVYLSLQSDKRTCIACRGYVKYLTVASAKIHTRFYSYLESLSPPDRLRISSDGNKSFPFVQQANGCKKIMKNLLWILAHATVWFLAYPRQAIHVLLSDCKWRWTLKSSNNTRQNRWNPFFPEEGMDILHWSAQIRAWIPLRIYGKPWENGQWT